MNRSPRLAAIDPATYRLPADVADRLCSPALVIYLDAVRSNLARMLDYMGGDPDRWRPHLKTTKTPEVWRELLQAGIRSFKCATTREAAVLLELVRDLGVAGADLLVAYPLVGPNLQRVAALAAAHPDTRVSVLSEDPEHARRLPPGLGVFVDINPEMDRTGVPVADLQAIVAVARAAGERLRGLHFYDGHVRDPAIDSRRRRCWDLYDRLLGVVDELQAAGLPVGEVVTSGTPAFPYALAHPGLAATGRPRHRVSPGTVVFHDAFSDDLLADVELRPAALVFSRVVSRPAGGRVTCDAGSKSLAAEAGDPAAVVLGWPGLVAERPSEEHLPLRVESGPVPERGETLLLVPRHVCPTVNLAEAAVLVAAGTVPRTVAVTARAHELFVDPSEAAGR